MVAFKGPFGFWMFPLINLILGMAPSFGKDSNIPKSGDFSVSAENLEEWKLIRDPVSGRLMGLEVHREVKQHD